MSSAIIPVLQGVGMTVLVLATLVFIVAGITAALFGGDVDSLEERGKVALTREKGK